MGKRRSSPKHIRPKSLNKLLSKKNNERSMQINLVSDRSFYSVREKTDFYQRVCRLENSLAEQRKAMKFRDELMVDLREKVHKLGV